LRKQGLESLFTDAIFMLVNPGGCVPVDQNYDIPFLVPRTTTIPFVDSLSDQTQWQLMRLMKLKNWNQTVIMNLSDIRSGNMNIFKHDLERAERVSYQYHSILSEQREEEFKSLLQNNHGPIIGGWGTDKRIKSLAERALQKESFTRVLGVKLSTFPYYLHPKPMIQQQRLEWLKRMNILIG
jgi:hypothetical protein